MILRLWAWLTGGRVVWLLDFDGETTRTIARPCGFGLMKASRMIGTNVSLHKDGSVQGASYVKRWEYEKGD